MFDLSLSWNWHGGPPILKIRFFPYNMIPLHNPTPPSRAEALTMRSQVEPKRSRSDPKPSRSDRDQIRSRAIAIPSRFLFQECWRVGGDRALPHFKWDGQKCDALDSAISAWVLFGLILFRLRGATIKFLAKASWNQDIADLSRSKLNYCLGHTCAK